MFVYKGRDPGRGSVPFSSIWKDLEEFGWGLAEKESTSLFVSSVLLKQVWGTFGPPQAINLFNTLQGNINTVLKTEEFSIFALLLLS